MRVAAGVPLKLAVALLALPLIGTAASAQTTMRSSEAEMRRVEEVSRPAVTRASVQRTDLSDSGEVSLIRAAGTSRSRCSSILCPRYILLGIGF
ncbi:MAG TPA: hypothetical protein VHL98_20950 [Microvirga sp.]|jgi:hypothetical protein|nr:hypothetical protein [Microvirga sp.]